MFQAAELGRALSKEAFEELEPELRARVLEAQIALRESGHSVLVIIEGMDGAGRGSLVNRLYGWFDPRGLETHTFWDPSDEELERPYLWRYWRAMPPVGEIGIFMGGWYRDLVTDAVHERIDHPTLDRRLQEISELERMLALDNVIVLKFWLHLPEEVQRERLENEDSTPDDRWGKKGRRKAPKFRKRFVEIGERVMRGSDTALAPWFLVEATDARYRDVTVAQTIVRTLAEHGGELGELRRMTRQTSESRRAPAMPYESSAMRTVLDNVDLDLRIGKSDYKKELAKLQASLRDLAWKAFEDGRSTVVVFEGWDAAGKGGAIRRLTAGLDARLYRTAQYGAPTEVERRYPYLWRFWRDLPRDGRILIFDRSWYGRVLVERVEGFATDFDWQRAYREINAFEHELTRHGVRLAKFWLHIDKDEQLARFKEREETPYKQHKITEEDWRNREKWDDYRGAVNEMVFRTGTEYAPWTLVSANDKRNARIEVLRHMEKLLKKG
ncbi:MAG: polyphosphate:AMP phosphotransferase [Halothiobacillaceae bacterium]